MQVYNMEKRTTPSAREWTFSHLDFSTNGETDTFSDSLEGGAERVVAPAFEHETRWSPSTPRGYPQLSQRVLAGAAGRRDNPKWKCVSSRNHPAKVGTKVSVRNYLQPCVRVMTAFADEPHVICIRSFGLNSIKVSALSRYDIDRHQTHTVPFSTTGSSQKTLTWVRAKIRETPRHMNFLMK